jgi:LCP family protein required for cell wall assembly
MGGWAQVRRKTRICWRIALALAGLGAGHWLGERLLPRQSRSLDSGEITAVEKLADPPHRAETLLLMGLDSDRLDGRRQGQVQLLLLARIHPEGGLELLQIPSELSVQLPGQKRLQPLADLHRQGGVALTADVVGQLLADGADPVAPDRYLLMPRAALRQLIDDIGGVPVSLDTPLRYSDRAGKLSINLEAGQQWLNGQQLELLLRFHGPDKGDGGRRQRQQQLVLPLSERLMDASVAPRLPQIWSKLRKQVDTNLSSGEGLSLLAAGLRDPDRIQITRLPLSLESSRPRLDRTQAESLLEQWRRSQRPERPQAVVAIEGSSSPATQVAIERLQGAGWQVLNNPLSQEVTPPRTLILHGNNAKQAQEVRRALGLGELQRGPMPSGGSVQVLLGKDWGPKASP